MCYYRFYIFLGCGHSTFSSTPVRYCANATSLDAPDETQPENPPLPKSTDTKITTNVITTIATTSVVLDLEAGSQPQVTQALATRDWQRLPTEKKISIPASRKLEYQPCEEGRAHPLHTRKVDTVCADCAQARLERLKKLDELPVVEVKFVRKIGGRRPPVKRKSEVMILQGKADKPKVDSGVWATGTKWMEGWKRGSG